MERNRIRVKRRVEEAVSPYDVTGGELSADNPGHARWGHKSSDRKGGPADGHVWDPPPPAGVAELHLARLRLTGLSPHDFAHEVEAAAGSLGLGQARLRLQTLGLPSPGLGEPRIRLQDRKVVIQVAGAVLTGVMMPNIVPQAAIPSLTAFAEQLAVVLENYGAVFRGERAQELYRSAVELAGEKDTQQLLTRAVERAHSLLGADLTYIDLYDDERGTVVTTVAAGRLQSPLLGTAVPVGAGVSGRVAHTRQPLVTHDYLRDAGFEHRSDIDRVVRVEGIRALLGVPLCVRDETIGVLFAAYRKPHSFSANEVDLLRTLGDYAAQVLAREAVRERAVLAAAESQRARQIAEQEQWWLSTLNQLQTELTDLFLRDGTILDALQLLATTPGIAVRFVGADGRTAAATPVNRGHASSMHAAHSAAFAQVTVRASHVTLGVLEYEDREEEPNRVRLALLMESVGKILAIELMRERAAWEAERRHQRTLFDILLDPSVSVPVADSFYSSRAVLWPLLRKPRRAVVMQWAGQTDQQREFPYEQILEGWTQTRPHDLVAIHGAKVLVLTGIVEPTALVRHIRGLPRWPHLQDRGSPVRVVVGPVTQGMADDRQALVDCIDVLTLFGDHLQEDVTLCDDCRLLLRLFRQVPPLQWHALVQDTLGPLLETKEGWIATLYAYCTAGFNVKAAARSLHIHPNTLHYRLARIEKLLGRSIHDPQSMAPLQIALTAWKILDRPS